MTFKPINLSAYTLPFPGQSKWPQSGLVRGYHLHPPRWWICVFDGGHGLVQPQDSVLGVVQQHGCKLLHQGNETRPASNPAPLVMNSDQGSQFTGQEWIGLLKQHGIQISMDGKGRALDNAFVERFWRSLKYEEVYRREYANYRDAQRHIEAYIDLYNHRRPHSSLDGSTPAEIHHAEQKRVA